MNNLIFAAAFTMNRGTKGIFFMKSASLCSIKNSKNLCEIIFYWYCWFSSCLFFTIHCLFLFVFSSVNVSHVHSIYYLHIFFCYFFCIRTSQSIEKNDSSPFLSSFITNIVFFSPRLLNKFYDKKLQLCNIYLIR